MSESINNTVDLGFRYGRDLPKINCTTHGPHENYMEVCIKGHEGHYCMICMLDALNRVGIKKSELVNG